jgi:PPIC-type PPIASE domain
MVGAGTFSKGVAARGTESRWTVAVLALLVLASLSGCGRSGSESVAAKIGGDAVTTATVERWMSALAPEHQVPDAPSFGRCIARGESFAPGSDRSILEGECQQQYEALRKRALDLLISARWLIAEAHEEGLSLDAGEVSRRAASPGLAVRGGRLNAADRRLAAEAAVAAASIERKLGEANPVTQAQVHAYYRRNIARFTHAEERDIYLSEGIDTLAHAARLRQELVSGKADLQKNSLTETINRAHPPTGREHEAAMLHTIFTAKPGTFTQPQPFNEGWSFVKVIRVKPQTIEPLAKVRARIEARLAAEHLRSQLAAFIVGWQAKWKARTSCGHDYVMRRCRQSGSAPAAAGKLPFS